MRGGRGLVVAGAVVTAGVALFLSVRPPAAVGSGHAQIASPVPSPGSTPTSGPGRDLFLRDCAWCHGAQGEGTNRGPPLVGVGAADADFWLSTGRMPIPEPEQDPRRQPPHYPPAMIRALVEYVAALGPGPPIPQVDVASASLPGGAILYRDNCAACHGATGAGGALTSGLDAPPLGQSTPVQVAEAIRLGPGTMPAFGPEAIDDARVDAIARYVQDIRRPEDRGGNGLGHLGPIPEGMVAWLVGLLAIVLVTRWIGTSE
jgi:quinol---cytochrome-c reductase cytochrome c subunit